MTPIALEAYHNMQLLSMGFDMPLPQVVELPTFTVKPRNRTKALVSKGPLSCVECRRTFETTGGYNTHKGIKH